jgi:hypothetical protein
MSTSSSEKSLAPINLETSEPRHATDASASPFRLVVDPLMRERLRRALAALIENHDDEMARHVCEGRLALDSYKEYVEIFASSLRQTMESREGVSYLLRAAGFDVKPEEINLQPEIRWKG